MKAQEKLEKENFKRIQRRKQNEFSLQLNLGKKIFHKTSAYIINLILNNYYAIHFNLSVYL